MMPKPLLLTLLLAGFGFLFHSSSQAGNAVTKTPEEPVVFDRDIRPIFSNTCFKCHGPDAIKRKAKLRMDLREDAIVAHKEGTPIVPGNLAKSEVYQRIITTDPDIKMPPPKSGILLSPQQIKLIERWIAQGADYQPHWSYVPITRPPLPAVKAKRWLHNPIDAFILQRLETKGIEPSPEAERRTLLRRLSLDLTGLPPTPAEVDAFLKDKSDKAYERQVDRLLASPHYGEQMAMPWLDVVRFADTVGYHGDQNMNIFPYRDYVIDSFNKNKPFDQFTIEQLAGDLLPHPTQEQLIATGFNRLNMMTREGGAQQKEYITKYQGDRVRTVAMTWLGSTMGCCECHDHKFDPFTTKDFYSMEAFFADIRQWGVYADYGYTPNPDLAGWTNDHPFPPEIQVDNACLQQRMERLHKEISALAVAAASQFKTDPEEKKEFDQWCRSSLAFLKQSPTGWVTPKIVANAPPANLVVNEDGSVTFTDKPDANTPSITVTTPSGTIASIRLDLLPIPIKKDASKQSLFRGDAKSSEIRLSVLHNSAGRTSRKLTYYFSDADQKDDIYPPGSLGLSTIGINEVWKISEKKSKGPRTAVWLLKTPIVTGPGDTLTISLGKNSVGSVRFSVSPFAFLDLLKTAPTQDLSKALASGGKKDAALLAETYLLSTAWDKSSFKEYQKLQKTYAECRGGKAATQIVVAKEPITTRVLPRGNWEDEHGEIVTPAPPQFLPQFTTPDAPTAGTRTRLDLAHWLMSPQNPLPARVVMNRLWKQFFGTGLSAAVDDLGAQGEWPSHPELLNWLGAEFRGNRWDIKHMVKLIVLSATYRQDSKFRPELRENDPNNRLLAAQNPRRLEAEFVRDNALSIASLLNTEIGGPSVKPYQPPGYYSQIQFPDRDYIQDRDSRQYRRGLYMHWQRTFLHPMLANFDAPSREVCIGSRSLSNTPQQALTLLNDPEFFEAARVFALHVIASKATTDDARLNLIYQTALARPIQTIEKESLGKFLTAQRDYYQAHLNDANALLKIGDSRQGSDADPAELSAWTLVCRVVLNLQETITRY